MNKKLIKTFERNSYFVGIFVHQPYGLLPEEVRKYSKIWEEVIDSHEIKTDYPPYCQTIETINVYGCLTSTNYHIDQIDKMCTI